MTPYAEGVRVLAESGHDAAHPPITLVEVLCVAGFVLAVCALDMLINRKQHELSLKEALLQTVLFVTLGLAFGLVVLYFYGGIGMSEYFSIFTSEYSLSVDNLFIFMILFNRFSIPREIRPRALFWGINGAIVIRLGMILAGTAILTKFEILMLPVALYMLYTAYTTVKEEEETDITEMWPYKLVTKFIPVTYRTFGVKWFIQQGGRKIATTFFLVVSLLWVFDGTFALDSVPTAIALSTIPLVTVAGNINAVLGLRPLFFVISHLTKYITRLNWGVGGILAWIGIKILLGVTEYITNEWMHKDFHYWHPSSTFSLSVIGVCLLFGLVAGKIWPVDVEEKLAKMNDENEVLVSVYVDCGNVMEGEWSGDLMARYLPEVIGQARFYDSRDDIIVYGFGDRIDTFDEIKNGGLTRLSLGPDSDLAAVLRHAKEQSATIKGTHIVMVVTAGMVKNKHQAVQAFSQMPEDTFVVFFRVSDEPGGGEFLQELDDLFEGERDRCNTVHVTDDHGVPLHEIVYEVGEELDKFLYEKNLLPAQREAA